MNFLSNYNLTTDSIRTILMYAIIGVISLVAIYVIYTLNIFMDHQNQIMYVIFIYITLLLYDNGFLSMNGYTISNTFESIMEDPSILFKNKTITYFLNFNIFITILYLIQFLTNKYVRIRKKIIILIQLIYEIVCIITFLGYVIQQNGRDSLESRMVLIVILVYLFRLLYQIALILNINVNKYIDVTWLEIDNRTFINFFQNIVNSITITRILVSNQ